MQKWSTCAIFGGSKGIGREIGNVFTKLNLNIALLSKTTEDCTGTKSAGGDAMPRSIQIQCDIREEKSIESCIKLIEDELGPIDVLINSAGINQDGLLVKVKKEDMDSQIATNLVGTMLTCKAVARSMIQRRHGCIINISSVVGSRGNVGQCVYSATKAGIEGFTKSLAKELGPKGIRVNCIAPGFISTQMTKQVMEQRVVAIPMGRAGRTEEVAQAAGFLLNAQYITGQVLYVDGGMSLVM